MISTKVLYGLIFSMLILGAASGATWYVDDDNVGGPWNGTQADPFQWIQDGINASVTGDTVLVMPGNYPEVIDFMGLGITVKSSDGPLTTVIDGGQFWSVVNFWQGEGRDAVIDGFTITNGSGTQYGGSFFGGGIYVLGAAPTIINNFIIDNAVGDEFSVSGFGGGISVNEYHPYETPLIQNNFILNNWSADDGAGISIGVIDSAGVEIVNNLIAWNETDDQSGESGGGIDVYHGYAYIASNTIYDNVAITGDGGGIRISYAGLADIYDCIIWENVASNGPQICDYPSTSLAYDSDIEGGTPADSWFGPGCFNLPPLFVAGPHTYGDFYLSQVAAGQTVTSPCVDYSSSAMIVGTTRTDEVQDQGLLDVGFHYPISSTPPDYYYVPDDFTTIQAAINAVPAGSTIIVRPGTYYENIDYIGKNVTVVSDKGPHVTTIDGNQSGSVVKFWSYESADAVLDGFTVTNGLADMGGGVYCELSDPTIVNNIITLNTSNADFGDGGIFCSVANPLIDNNSITENHADISGGGIRFEWCSATVTGCYIAHNTAYDGGGMVSQGFDGLIENCVVVDNTATRSGGGFSCDYYSTDATIINSVFAGNTAQNLHGGGLYLTYSSDATIVNCTIADNTAADGGGIFCYSASPSMVNSILWDNDAPNGPEITLLSSSTLTIDYSDVEGGQAGANVDAGSALNWGANMTIANPLFFDAPNRDYHLKWASGCRDVGNNSASGLPDEDFEGDPRVALGTVDMGADEFYYHLYHLGPVVPGQSLTIRIVGGPGMPTTLYLGSGIQDPPMSTQWGDFYLPWPTLWEGKMGSVPTSGIRSFNVTVPPTWAPGDWKPLQALVGQFSDPLAHLTNLMILYVE